jgi:hypothetical protein
VGNKKDRAVVFLDRQFVSGTAVGKHIATIPGNKFRPSNCSQPFCCLQNTFPYRPANVCCSPSPRKESLHESRTRLHPSLFRFAILRSFRLRPPSYLVPTKTSVISHCLCSNASTSLEESSDKSCPKTSKVSIFPAIPSDRPRDPTLPCHYTEADRTCLRLAALNCFKSSRWSAIQKDSLAAGILPFRICDFWSCRSKKTSPVEFRTSGRPQQQQHKQFSVQ